MALYVKIAWFNRACLGGILFLLSGALAFVTGLADHWYVSLATVDGFGLIMVTFPYSLRAYRRAYHSLQIRDGLQDADFATFWEFAPYCDRVGYTLAVRQWKRQHSASVMLGGVP